MRSRSEDDAVRVVHLDDHAAAREFPARRLEAVDGRFRVLVAESLDDAVSLLESEGADCLVATVGEPAGESPGVCCSRARSAVPDLPIVFFDDCDPGAVTEWLDDATSFVPRSRPPGDGSYELLANRVRTLVPRRSAPSTFDPLSEGLRALLDESPLPACVLRGETVTYANAAFRDRFGTPGGSFAADRLFALAVEGERELRELCEQPARGTASVAVPVGDGGQRRFEVAAASDDGAVLTLWADDRTADPASPSREESMLESLLEHLPVAVYFKDAQGRHVRVSEALVGMSAVDYLENEEGKRYLTAADVVGKTDFDLYPDEHARLTAEDDRQVVETERPTDLQEEYTRSHSDEDIWLLTCKAPWYGPDGEVAGVAGVTVDVTEQKRSRRDESPLDQRLDQFERVLTSTFRSELGGVADAVDRGLQGEPEAALRSIDDRLDVLERLLEDATTLARHAKTPARRSVVELDELLRSVWDDLDDDRGRLRAETDVAVFADEERLSCVLANLLEVLVEHGPEGVTLTARGLADGFYVERDGPPLAPAQRDALLEGRIDESAVSLGLAMTIVVGIAEACGWETTVSSDGRRFEVTGVELR